MAPPNIGSSPEQVVGYWGPPTSTLDWCENNYMVSYYIAEFWNTVTNLSMIIPPIYGIIDSYRQGFERRYMVCYALLLLTGIGSWMFHMTLLFGMQLLDELPMVWGGSFMLYSLYRARNSYKNGGKLAGIILGFYAIAVTGIYLINKNPIFHEVMYGILIGTIVLLAINYNRMIHYNRVANLLFFLVLLFKWLTHIFCYLIIIYLLCCSISLSLYDIYHCIPFEYLYNVY